MPSPPTVALYGRPDCHLCEEARDGLLGMLADGVAFELEEIDIESDEDLHRRYLERIPVIEVNGEIVSELHLDVPALKAELAAGRTHPGS
jgi:glutaredoxin